MTYKRFKDKAICGNVNIPALSECEVIDDFIFYNNKLICRIQSQNSLDHFLSNDDGEGKLRADYIKSIKKLIEKGNKSDKIKILFSDNISNKYRRQEHDDVWLWSYKFYQAPIIDLMHIKSIIQ